MKKPRSRRPKVQARPVLVDGCRWPEEVALPKRYERKPYMPCPQCMHVMRPDYPTAAVICYGIRHTEQLGLRAYLLCRHCGNKWSMAAV